MSDQNSDHRPASSRRVGNCDAIEQRITLKRCPRCAESKPLADFHRNKARPDGVHSVCKSCRKAPPKAVRWADDRTSRRILEHDGLRKYVNTVAAARAKARPSASAEPIHFDDYVQAGYLRALETTRSTEAFAEIATRVRRGITAVFVANYRAARREAVVVEASIVEQNEDIADAGGERVTRDCTK